MNKRREGEERASVRKRKKESEREADGRGKERKEKSSREDDNLEIISASRPVPIQRTALDWGNPRV